MADNPKSGWFAGPSGENSDAFAEVLRKIYQDYVYWRRNYFPDDGVIVDSHAKRESEPFWDEFGDRLTDLLAKLKADFPFYSPRYAAHMLSEQTLPSIAGMFAGLLYNPNNVSSEAAPVTVQMEIEVAKMISDMLGYGPDAWGHLTSGGTIANIEALWAARSTLFLPFVVRDVAQGMELDVPERDMDDRGLLALSPQRALRSLQDCFAVAAPQSGIGVADIYRRMRESKFNVAEHGLGSVLAHLDTSLVVIAPETHHYCIPKALDLLGLGRDALVRVPVDSNFMMRSEDLRRAVDEVESEGRTILAVVVVAGTTEEGSIDPIHEVVGVREVNEQSGRQSFWIHADAAYGGYLRTMTVPERIGLGSPTTEVLIDGERREIEIFLPLGSACDALESLGSCDSVAIDPHKLGYVPYPAGAVCFRSDLVKPVLRQDAPYIEGEMESPTRERRSKAIGVYVLEGSKPGMVAASLWLSHKLIPLDSNGHGRLMQETVRNAGELYTLLKDFHEISRGQKVRAVPLCPPGSNIVCFTFVPLDRKMPLNELNEANQALYERFTISETGSDIHHQEFFVSRTVLRHNHYRWETVEGFLKEIGGTQKEFEECGTFLLRSVLMNPWYSDAKKRGRYYVSEFVAELYRQANDIFC
ncbi:MAG TPA: pyridoxal-dependent decarboxylase [Fimbriimonadaceae bacterium]|nr:pyridoxal-dependent decarboxylase [Fimbriimonadaceae bacterium]